MNDLMNLLKDAFDAGMNCASAYEMGGYAPNFKKWSEENKSDIEQMFYENEVNSLHQRLEFLQDELNALRDKDFHQYAYVQTLQNLLASDSVYTLLRYGCKSSTIIDGMDDQYIDLYNISEELRTAVRADIQNKNDEEKENPRREA